MKKIIILIICILMTVINTIAQTSLPKDFSDLMVRANMEFIQPDSFVTTSVIHNKQVLYEYAVKHRFKHFEIRYSIRPLDEQMKIYMAKKNNKQGDIFNDPNTLFLAYFYAVVSNISNNNPVIGYNLLNKDAVKKEFNADWGAEKFVELNKQFGQDYKYCLVVTLHKNDFGDAYCFYLSDNKENFASLLQRSFHSLKFKNLSNVDYH